MKIKAFNYITGYFQEQLIEITEENPSKCLIGRHPNCDFVLNSPEVSRIHAIILYQDKKYYYIDLASTDGSKINNLEATVNESVLLKLGDIIRIGDFIVLFEFEESILHSEGEPLSDANTLIFPNINQQKQQTEFTVRCCDIIEETDDVKTFRLVAEPPILFNDASFNYKPGQFVMLDLEIGGKQVKRAYSISSSPSRPYNLEITVKRVSAPQNQPYLSPGLVSNCLHDYFKVGDKLKISPPMGDFNYFENSHKKLVFISAGSGITPLMSMSRWICDTNANISVIFIYSARTQEDIIFREELELMAAKYSNFQLAINLTGKEFDLNWTGYKGRLNETMLLEMAPDLVERIAYVCGSESFLESVETILGKIQFPMHNYYQESFGLSTGVKTALIPTSQAVVVFKKSEQEVICSSNETILEAAQREAISLPYGCQMGVCGQCKLRKVSGKVTYDKDFGCDDDYVLTCVAKVAENVVIEG
ncbi:flavodoxin reductase family protein [Rivularia sp. PCC 7116]|uniref:FHA domain-containing protein n=1 Tax=Rivularia sp. PCC 7116 TaxID=373994 RepID=UPI00029F0EA9|nr:FHA domain-containing protein [Rivularia sp. PCC 7116]AFY58019.1 flavodoxin reductase family protein [Rivularia sp. PCC 7116]